METLPGYNRMTGGLEKWRRCAGNEIILAYLVRGKRVCLFVLLGEVGPNFLYLKADKQPNQLISLRQQNKMSRSVSAQGRKYSRHQLQRTR